ncbi:MAG: GGDEF domain-containing protein [Hyphomicrobium sp.]|jgi:diguanylate cyclase (GGDEF)-like protein
MQIFPNASITPFFDQMRSVVDVGLQPICDIQTGVPHAFESLVRNTASLGFASISDFFDHAASLSALSMVDNVLNEKAARKLCLSGHAPGALLFLNLDRRRIPTLPETLPGLAQTILAAGLEPDDICLEITEGGSTTSSQDLLRAVTSLRQHGFRLAIDDFGTGFSGLQALYQCQPDYVKIDRFFISGLDHDGRKRLFISRVVELAHVLGIKVVAEGVERVEELHACRDAGCDLVQGYFVAHPSCGVSELKPVYRSVSDNPDRRSLPRSMLTLEAENVITKIQPVVSSERLGSVVDYFLTHPESSFVPVVDNRSMPLGIIRERDLRGILQLSFGRDLLKNSSCALSLNNFLLRLPVFDADVCPAHLIEQSAHVLENGVLVTKNSQYAGVITSTALLRLAGQICLREARNQNPLTHLPANDAILGHVSRACANGEVDQLFCYLDFDHFKPFNDVYGFHRGDRAIIMFAELLRSEFGYENIFLGHVGGDDFFVGATGEAQDFAARLRGLTRRFASNAESLYSTEHRQHGYLETKGRDGIVVRFPLLTCSVGLVDVPAGAGEVATTEIVEKLARVKTAAKQSATRISFGSLLRRQAHAA